MDPGSHGDALQHRIALAEQRRRHAVLAHDERRMGLLPLAASATSDAGPASAAATQLADVVPYQVAHLHAPSAAASSTTDVEQVHAAQASAAVVHRPKAAADVYETKATTTTADQLAASTTAGVHERNVPW